MVSAPAVRHHCLGGVLHGESLPYWPINPSLSTNPIFNFQLDLMRAIWVLLPSTLLWGASFPLALAAVALPGQDPGRLVGGVYAANTVGAIIGALVTGLVLVGTVGSQVAQQILIGIAATSGVLVLVGLSPAGKTEGVLRLRTAAVVVAGACIVAVVLARSCRRCPDCWWRTAATRRRGSVSIRSSTSARGSRPRSPSRGPGTAC